MQRTPCDITVNELDWGLEISKFEIQSYCYVPFWTNILGKDIEPSCPPPPAMGYLTHSWGDKGVQYHCCSSTRMVLAWNNTWRLNKETKLIFA